MEWLENIETIKNLENTCVAFGNFDGVHKGHLAVVEQLVNEGKKRYSKTVIISCFSEKLTAEKKLLTTEEEKVYFLEKSGLDFFVSQNTDIDSWDKEEFIRNVVIAVLGAKVIVAGRQNKEIELLKKICGQEGIELITVEAVTYNNQIITKELVRKAFMDCRFEDMARMCGHAYVMSGTVEHGKALGRTVGMPTANLGVPEVKLMPPSGVYATLTDVEGQVYKGLTNIGTRPSVDSMSHITIETFLLDFSRDIYGKKLVMEVHLYIRGVQKFDSLDKVQQQVQKDLGKVKEYLDSRSLMHQAGA